MDYLIACAVGLLAGAHTSTWGMYKDAIHEGFSVRKFARSILISVSIAPLLIVLGFPLTGLGSLVVLFGTVYVLERAAAEFYKTFLRNEDQSKYFIPMQFAVRGTVVHSRAKRLLAGVAAVVVGLVLLALAASVESRSLAAYALTGSLGGWFSAVGGAWKDAPHEGFDLFKFLRSPVMTAAYAVLLARFTNSLVLAALAGLGLTIATLETYKTFCFPSKPRGKFAGKPIHFPAMLHRRNWFVPLYASIWMLLLTALIAAE